MQKRAGLLAVFLLFFSLSLGLLFLFRDQTSPFVIAVGDVATSPLQRSFYSAFGGILVRAGREQHMAEVNQELAKKLTDQSALVKETKALRDQYDQEEIPSKSLLSARVIGMKSFVPGVSFPEEIILDKGSAQHVRVGQTVVLRNNVVGDITAVAPNRSLVSLISKKTQSLTAKTRESEAIGVLRGKGNGNMTLENVVLSDTLKKNDIVVTKGGEDLDGTGYPPDLVIGRITTVGKKASDLFQTAEIESLLNFAKLDYVFIMTQ